eukprot:TRINITY_DN1641_c0_g1_i3.p1 TRINITY_DN1641_c0_g1~~TRINITY_DN1641_c0_g1_i3.p1  ORF type:complete len:75 (+),score=2.07 TRINITY_DN1641_c0_g1_i3:135-359(+)
MPKLNRDEEHKCPLCPYSSQRKNLKTHLTTAGKKGPKCPGLRVVVPKDVWANDIVPYYSNDSPLPDLGGFIKSF